METRQPGEKIIEGLQTTSDKIRALAQASYDRTEISRFLGIRYQHVHNVLLRSGIDTGLRRQVDVEREPVTVDAEPAPKEDTSWTVLTDAGFQYLGEWTYDPESLLRLDAKAPAAPGVYAFVVDNVVVYVGLTLSGLKRGWISTAAATSARGPASISTAEFRKPCSRANKLRCLWPRPSRRSGRIYR